MIETLEKSIVDKEKLEVAKSQLDDIVSIVVEDCESILERYDEKVELIENKNIENEMRIAILEEKVKYFEKMIELDDYDFFITCPYCGFEFQTDYDDEIETIICPECGQTFDIDWDEDEGEDDNESDEK